MRRFDKIAIIGVGMIGGSIGLAAKRRGLAKEVAGVFRRRSTMINALKRAAVDTGTTDMRRALKGADLVIVATPVMSIPALVAEVADFAGRGTVITDAGSSKEWIVARCERILSGFPSLHFVGSHPMAGSELTGVGAARADLFEGSPCIVTRTPRTDRASLGLVAGFWRALGGRVKVMSPAAHDRTVSLISHLPHMVAFSLAGSIHGREMECAAEGFKDTTRVASSDPRLWADIFLTNKKALLAACGTFDSYYRKIMKAVARGDYYGTVRALKAAKSKRDRLIYGEKS